MNWIDILVLVITILILVAALIGIIFKFRSDQKCSCPAVKKYKKSIKKAHKAIEKEKKNNN